MNKFSRLTKALLLVNSLALALSVFPLSSYGQDDMEVAEADIFEMPLEDLVNLKVVSPSRMDQLMFDSPNAIWVITSEDIKESGVRTIPEALRLAPGVNVMQLSGNRWAVTIGGFSRGQFSNTLLVLVDGVTVYSTLFGYVEWDLLPVTLDEIDRIEVIRGPGGVLYGANAVNGVINIITKAPDEGRQSYVTADVGTQGVLSTHAGTGMVSEDGKFMATLAAGYDQDNGLGRDNGDAVYDYQRLNTVAARTVTLIGDKTKFSLDGRFKTGEYAQPAESAVVPEHTYKPESSIARIRLDHRFTGGSQLYLQAFYRRHLVFDLMGTDYVLHQDGRTEDVEFQHMIPFEALGGHKLIYGGGYRWIDIYHDNLEGNAPHFYSVANVFVHDEWSFHPDWRLNLGVKWEQQSIIEPTWQWRAALLYYPAKEHVLRVSAANSYRSPTMLEYYQEIIIWPPGPPQPVAELLGNDELKPEEMYSYEFEYRGLWFDKVYIDASYSYRQFYNLIAQHSYMDGMTQIYVFDNGNEATVHTAELGLDARLSDNLRSRIDYGYVDMAITGKYDLESVERRHPKHFGRAGLSYSDEKGFMADANAYYTGSIPEFGASEKIDEYWRLDLRLAKRFPMASGELEVGAVGQNLGQEWHQESTSDLEIRRSYYGYVEYRNK